MSAAIYQHLGSNPCDPIQVMKSNLDRLNEGMEADIYCIIDKLYARSLISRAIVDDIKTGSSADYRTASKLGHEILRQLRGNDEPTKHLMKICSVLLTIEDPNLTKVTEDILHQSGCSHYVSSNGFTIVFSGIPQSGKSKLISGLFQFGLYEAFACCPAETFSIEIVKVSSKSQNVPFNNGYLQNETQQLKQTIDKANLSVHCIDMSSPLKSSAMTAIYKYITTNPKAVLKTIIALTKANAIKYPVECQTEEEKKIYFERKYQTYIKDIKEYLKSCLATQEVIDELAFAPTGDYLPKMVYPRWLHAGCPDWSYNFWLKCIERLSQH